MHQAVRADGRGVTFCRRAFALTAALMLSGLVALSPAGAADAPAPALPPATPGAPPPAEPAAPVVPAPPPVAPPGANEAGRREAAARVRGLEEAVRTAERQETIAIDRVRLSEIRLGEARARVEEVTGAQLLAAQELAAARSRMRSLAVASYVRGGSGTSIAYVLEAKDPVEMIRRNALIDSAAVVHHNTATVYELAKAAASRELVEAIAAVDRQTSVHAQAQAEVEVLAVISAEHRFALDYGRQLLDLVTAAAPVAPSDIPRLYLDAYRQAASTLAKRMPACRVRWSAVAAIGKIESNHGRYRGTQLALNGDAYPRIIGIPLDGTNNTRAIPDSEQGLLDGDPVWDRAVGPMQFIPTTWQRLAQDGNGDGVLDPNNAYDATLATATYLCRSNPAGGLDTDEGLRPSFFAYNRSETYVENVLAWTSIYAAMDAELPQPPPPPPPPPPTPPARRR